MTVNVQAPNLYTPYDTLPLVLVSRGLDWAIQSHEIRKQDLDTQETFDMYITTHVEILLAHTLFSESLPTSGLHPGTNVEATSLRLLLARPNTKAAAQRRPVTCACKEPD